MQQAPSICCAILSWSQLPYGLRFPEAGLLTKCPLALTRHHSPHIHTYLYSLIKSGSLQLNARQYFFQKILCLPGSSLGVPCCGLRALCAWKKKQPVCPVPSLGLGQMGSTSGAFWLKSDGKHDAGHSSAVGNILINLSSLGVASVRHNRSP